MTLLGLAAIALVSLAIHLALWMVLAHQSAMRATSGEMALLRNQTNGAIDQLHLRLKGVEERLTLLNNRTQR